MPHIKIGSKVKIKNYSPTFNSLIGEVLDRDGEYYKVGVILGDEYLELWDLYNCELECMEDN